jgi:hypothetical protein
MDIKGYCLLKKDPTTAMPVPSDIKKFIGCPLRIIDVNPEGDVLVISPEADEVILFLASDIKSKFLCGSMDEFITPPGLDYVAQVEYCAKLISRKEGYHLILKHMVIAASLHAGKFNDSMLWQSPEQEIVK